MFKIVLIALDAREESDRVFEIVNRLQLQSETKIVLSHVIPPPDPDPDRPADRPQSGSSEWLYPEIEAQLQRYRDRLPCQSQLEIVSGDPAEEIVRLANLYGADLIAIGSRGLTGLSRILAGSVSSQVVEDAPCSVLVVKP